MRRVFRCLPSLLLLCLACRGGELNEITLAGMEDGQRIPVTGSPVGTPPAGASDGGAAPSNGIAKNANAARALTTVKAAAMDTLATKVPAPLHAQFEHIEATAAAYNLQPQLLVAVAMQESTGGTDKRAYENGGGMFQFTDVDTWKRYGTKNPNDRSNDALSVTAAAYYLADELNGNDGDLTKALRAYNGAIANGGIAEYPQQVMAKMTGAF